MWDFFRFPEEYQVKKKLGKERFLKNANFSRMETKRFGLSAENIQILYDIILPDNSEMIVLSTEADISQYQSKRDTYLLENYCRAIAQSFPYQCLIVLRYKSAVKLILPEERNNIKDSRRMLVEKFFATPLLRMDQWDFSVSTILPSMRNCIAQANSVDELFKMWKDVICGDNESFARGEMDNGTFTYEREQLDDILGKEQEFRNATTLDDDKFFSTDSTYYADVTSDEELCVECFSENCWPLFEKCIDNDLLDDEEYRQRWIDRYCTLCGEVFEEAFNRQMANSELRRIVARFEQQRAPDDQVICEDELLEALMQRLDDYYLLFEQDWDEIDNA